MRAGYDFFTAEILYAQARDAAAHGTMCAGVLAAVANNSKCTVGVAYNSKLAGE